MDLGRSYRIAFKGLKNGSHPFSFHIGEDFFESYEHSSIQKGDLSIDLDLDKRDAMMILSFSIKGSIQAGCDRCLSVIPVPMEAEEQIIVQFDEVERDEEEIVYIDPKRNYLELKDIIYELVHVNRPVRNTRDCEAEGRLYCDLEVLNRLVGNSGESDVPGDVWDSLKNLNL